VFDKHRKPMRFVSMAYWDKCLETAIDSIREDKESILNLVTYGSLGKAQIIINLDADKAPSYQIRVDKIAEKSPFGEDEEE
jgi:hypothetical protein